MSLRVTVIEQLLSRRCAHVCPTRADRRARRESSGRGARSVEHRCRALTLLEPTMATVNADSNRGPRSGSGVFDGHLGEIRCAIPVSSHISAPHLHARSSSQKTCLCFSMARRRAARPSVPHKGSLVCARFRVPPEFWWRMLVCRSVRKVRVCQAHAAGVWRGSHAALRAAS